MKRKFLYKCLNCGLLVHTRTLSEKEITSVNFDEYTTHNCHSSESVIGIVKLTGWIIEEI